MALDEYFITTSSYAEISRVNVYTNDLTFECAIYMHNKNNLKKIHTSLLCRQQKCWANWLRAEHKKTIDHKPKIKRLHFTKFAGSLFYCFVGPALQRCSQINQM